MTFDVASEFVKTKSIFRFLSFMHFKSNCNAISLASRQEQAFTLQNPVMEMWQLEFIIKNHGHLINGSAEVTSSRGSLGPSSTILSEFQVRRARLGWISSEVEDCSQRITMKTLWSFFPNQKPFFSSWERSSSIH